MGESSTPRKQLRAALDAAGLTMGQYAAMLGISRPHLYFVLRGVRQSPRVTAAITAYIAAYRSAA